MKPIVVIGAGVAGLTLAIALKRRGIAVQVFERASAIRAEGGALLLWSNGVRALDELGLGPKLRSVASVVDRTEFRRHDGVSLWTLSVSALSEEAGAPSMLVGRAELLSLLAEEAGTECVTTDQAFVGFEPLPCGVRAHFRPGTFTDARGLVGADGLYSTVRQQLLGLETIRSADQIAWVGLARRPDWPPPGTAIATVGDGLRFWAGRVDSTRVYWYATLPDPPTNAPRTQEQVAALLADFHDPVPAVIRATPPSACVRTVIADRRPVQRWGRGDITLVGDAAHPCTPDLGQGACQGIESACALATWIAACDEHDKIADAMRAYERDRQPRTQNVTALSRTTARLSAASGPLAGRVRDLGVRVVLPAVAMPRLRWLLGGNDAKFDEDVEGPPSQPVDLHPADDQASPDGLW